jgi:starch synthase
MFLMPSLYEPCGLNQMYSLKIRLGAARAPDRRSGGLGATLGCRDRRGTGIVFNDFDASCGALGAAHRARSIQGSAKRGCK